jgi:antitoxin component YwqK of YwqJK toxin-antitoxin module
MIDSVIKYSDSSYVKPYKRSDFVNAFFYINKKDSSVCQLMKDSSGNIRQIIIARKNTRIFFAQYYTNGQLQAELPLDEFGQYHGTATYYYQSGIVQSRGAYFHGLKAGKWKSYDETGKLLSTNEYDSSGQLIKPAGKN